MLLKNSLGGNAKTIMIAAVSPASVNYDVRATSSPLPSQTPVLQRPRASHLMHVWHGGA